MVAWAWVVWLQAQRLDLHRANHLAPRIPEPQRLAHLLAPQLLVALDLDRRALGLSLVLVRLNPTRHSLVSRNLANKPTAHSSTHNHLVKRPGSSCQRRLLAATNLGQQP